MKPRLCIEVAQKANGRISRLYSQSVDRKGLCSRRCPLTNLTALPNLRIIDSLDRSDVNNTCPICRDEIHGNKDFWEMPEPPSKGEIGQFVMGMAEGAGAST